MRSYDFPTHTQVQQIAHMNCKKVMRILLETHVWERRVYYALAPQFI